MRLYDSSCTTCSKNRVKMPISGTRSAPNEMPQRSSCGITTVTSWQEKQDQQMQQHQTRSWPGSYKASSLEPVATGGEEVAPSSESRRRTQSVSSDLTGNSKRANSNKPLIHHQRHSLKNKFQVLNTLGEGTYGKVKLAIDKGTGEHVALKYIKKTKIQDEMDQTRIRREIQILSSLRHEHIVNVREVFERKDKIVLVMDYAPGGELYDYLNKMGRLSEQEARRIFRQIVSAVHHCHQNGVVHRDLKLENIILDNEGNVKIADFGLSNYFRHDSTLSTFCGSPLYASPEIVNGKPYQGPEVDVWSLGVILYTLVYGAMPFESSNVAILRQQISHGLYSAPVQASEAAGLIHHMLTVAPSRRATMEDILHHWWLNLNYPTMPNNRPYKPDTELTDTVSPGLAAGRNPTTTSESQMYPKDNRGGNLSSDSDVEMDFGRSLCSAKAVSGYHNDITVVASESVGHVSDEHDCQQSRDIPESAPVLSNKSKLPHDVLEILLKGCSKKTLRALFGSEKTSPQFGVDINRDVYKVTSKSDDGERKTESADFIQKPRAISDSEKRPSRGILKRKGKFSGGDSGCVINEEMSRHEDASGEDSSHLHLKSQCKRTDDPAAPNERTGNLIGNDARYTLHDNNYTGISHSALNISSCPPKSQLHGSRSSHDILKKAIALPKSSDEETHTHISADDTAKLYFDCDCKTGSDSDKIVALPKSILKNCKRYSLEDGIKRLSISSYGSNSSIDMFDLSYDSADSGHVVNHRHHFSPIGNINNIEDSRFDDDQHTTGF